MRMKHLRSSEPPRLCSWSSSSSAPPLLSVSQLRFITLAGALTFGQDLKGPDCSSNGQDNSASEDGGEAGASGEDLALFFNTDKM
ncbi:hypothetical protein H920_11323 [Fukomys damarensis]|uniref:Uncharacterized protein n=1 Tax=Fukomys damarensis TaxID=885580 RepID=A0A091DAL9_FUKDA|nr:hypothetical protein H920_11323 [Fukomys damarensis]